MSFLSPVFLLGGLAALLPVLVHLVRRTRARRVEFPSLMFLRKIEQRTIRRRRLRNLALLIIRCLALLLLALAFARPYLAGRDTSASTLNQPASVILIDRSYSMRYPGVFDRARQAAMGIVNDSVPGELMAIVGFAQDCQIFKALNAGRSEALEAVGRIEPGFGSTDFLQALQTANSILKEAGKGRLRVFLISDFQAVGWDRSAPPVKLLPRVELVPLDVSEGSSANIAVTEVSSDPVIYSQKYTGKVIAHLQNFSQDPNAGRPAPVVATVELKLNDLLVERRQVEIGPRLSQTVEFSGFNLADGSNKASVEISGDQFTTDNRFFFTIKRDVQTKVLAIDTAVRGRSESFFIRQSLLAGENSPFELTVKSTGQVSPSELSAFKAVILNDVSGVSDALAAALKSFVEAGGGLLIGTGKHADSSELNRLFGAILPATVGEVVQARALPSLISVIKTEHPVFQIFAKNGRLASIRVYAYHRTEPAPQASVIAALDDGSPLVVEGPAGSGKVMVITTSLDNSWNDLPVTPLFLPLIREVLAYMCGTSAQSHALVGQVFSVAADRDGSMPAVEGPDGKLIEGLSKDSAGNLVLPLDAIGFYRLHYRARAENIAVDLDTRESDLLRLNMEEFLTNLAADPVARSTSASSPERQSPEQIESSQRLWLPLLVFSLVLFLVEAIIARSTRVRSLIA